MRCFDCQPLLLDHLYGLLDPADAAALEGHLAGCADCAAARDRAAREAGLLARAAKVTFPQVRFVAPTDAVPSSVVTPARRERVWGRWAVAAAVWALVPATLIPLSRLNDRAATGRADADAAYAGAKTTANDLNAAGRAGERYAAAKKQTEAALAAWVAAERAAEDTARAKPAEVRVTRPESLQPGAPNEFVVALRPRGTALDGRPVTAEVRDGAGAVLHAEPLAAKTEDQRVRLPADVWAKVAPGAELFLTVSTTTPAGAREELIEPVRLFGPVYATMLVTDRAAYRPGERVFFRSLTLDRTTFRPPPHEQALAAVLRRRDGSDVGGTTVYGTTGLVRDGQPVLGPDGQPVRGVGVGEIVLPDNLPEGEYLLTLAEVPGRGGRPAAMAAPVTRTIRVEAGATGQFAKTITATPAGPGQAAAAVVEVKSKGRPLAGADVSAVATVDGAATAVVRVLDKQTDASGKARIVVSLPVAKDIPRGDVRLRVTVRHGGVEETVAERIPVAGKDVVVEFFPEGGTLVAGVPNRVYVRATTPAGVPVGVSGTVAGDAGPVAKVEEPAREALTARGLGVITFTPKAGTTYRLTLAERGGRTFDLPPAAADGVAMTVLDPVTAPGQPVRVRLVSAGRDRTLVVGAYTRGRLSDTKAVAAKAGAPVEVSLLAGPESRGGVVRLTAFEEANGLRPVAERLAFRRPGEALRLDLGVAPAKAGETQLHVAATDEKGNPAAAILWAAAVNAAAAPGLKDRSLPTHFLLAGEVEAPDDLEHADFLLTDHPAAAAGLDLVLATQGWRRFVEQQDRGAIARNPQAANRLLAMTGATPVGSEPSPAHRRLFETHWPRYEESVRELDAAQAERASSGANAARLMAAYEERRRETAALAAAAEEAAAPLVAARGWVTAGAVGLGLLAVGAAGLGFARPHGARGVTPLATAAFGAGLLAVLLGRMAPDAGDGPEYVFDAPKVTAPGAEPAPGVAPVPPSAPVIPPPQVAVVTKDGKIEPPAVTSSHGMEKLPKTPRTIPDPPAPAPKVQIPDIELLPAAPGVAPRPKAPAPGVRRGPVPTDDAALVRARELARPIEAIFADAAKGDVIRERLRASVPWVPPLAVREYAAPRPGAGSLGAQPDTVLWQPLIVLPSDGRTTLSFFPGAAAGGYEVVVAGHTPDGRIGTVRRVVPGARD